MYQKQLVMNYRDLSPETLMMGYGYNPELSEGAIKCPIFQTSTFVFKTAEEGKAFFEVAYGLRTKRPDEKTGLIYSRLNNPDMEILEERLKLWDGAEACAAFASGMSAIATVLLEFLKPGDLLLHSAPLYGGTHHLIHHFLAGYGINIMSFTADQTADEIEEMLIDSGQHTRLRMILMETPANPTNDIIDIERMAELAKRFSTQENKVYLAVDNTYMGPLWQHPLKHGADLVIYSATKYIGGHSDVIAGAVVGSEELIHRVKVLRTFLGNMISPHSGWLLMRSLETLKVRMEQQALNAEEVAAFLHHHPKVTRVHYPLYLHETDPEQYHIFKKQCSSSGAMVSFDIAGGEKEAFMFLNNLKLIKLAVSLGSTESLAEHPATMTHVDIPEEDRLQMKVTPSLVRISVGIENYKDIIWDIEQALQKVKVPELHGAL